LLFLSLFPLDWPVPRLLITAGLAPTARSIHTHTHTRTHNKHESAHILIFEHIHSGINLCFLHASLKIASHLSSYTNTHKNTLYWKRVGKGRFKKKKGKARLSQPFFLVLFSLPFFTDPSFLPSIPLFSPCSFHPFDRWATFVEMERIWKCVWWQDPEWGRQREGGRQQGHLKEKMKSDLVDPWICGRRRGRKIKVWAQCEAGS